MNKIELEQSKQFTKHKQQINWIQVKHVGEPYFVGVEWHAHKFRDSSTKSSPSLQQMPAQSSIQQIFVTFMTSSGVGLQYFQGCWRSGKTTWIVLFSAFSILFRLLFLGDSFIFTKSRGRSFWSGVQVVTTWSSCDTEATSGECRSRPTSAVDRPFVWEGDPSNLVNPSSADPSTETCWSTLPKEGRSDISDRFRRHWIWCRSCSTSDWSDMTSPLASLCWFCTRATCISNFCKSFCGRWVTFNHSTFSLT